MNRTMLMVIANVLVLILIGSYRLAKDKKVKAVYLILVVTGITNAMIQLPLAYYQEKETAKVTAEVNQNFDSLEQKGADLAQNAEKSIEGAANNENVNHGIDYINEKMNSLSPQSRHIVNRVICFVIMLIFLLIGYIIGKFTGVFKKVAIWVHGSNRVTVMLLTTMNVIDLVWLFYSIITF